jgi:MaoC dehydratase-like protein
MSGEPTLDFVPEELSAEAKEKLRALARESRPEPAAIEVDEYLIRHWCETLEDGNPLYLDAAYARSRGYRSVVAPPGSVMTTFAMPLRWPWPPGGREPARHIHYEVKELLNLPVGIITTIEVEVGAPLQVGDRVSVSQRLVSISPWKKTRLGEGHFWTMDRLYRNQGGELVLRERMTAFGYGREAAAAGVGASKGGWSPAVEEVIRGGETGYQPAPRADRFWDDVAEGEELPRLVLPITVTRCVYSNRDYAQERSKTKDVFVNTPFNLGMISRFLTDWGGPRSTVRRMQMAMRDNVCAGDDMIMTGRVVRRYVEQGDHRVDLEIVIATQAGPVTPCTATLALPTR